MWVLLGSGLTSENQLAKRICQRCPIRTDCLRIGLSDPVMAKGFIWGGEEFR